MTIAAAVLVALFLVPVGGLATTIIQDPADAAIHDILSVSGGFDATTLFVSATFRPDTLDANNLGFGIVLDTDLNLATGHQFGGQTGHSIGGDFFVFFHRPSDPPGVALVQSINQITGFVPVFFGPDSLAVAVPLSLVGNDDGAADFGLQVGTPLPSTEVTFLVTDFAYAGRTTPVSAPVPEPGNLMLVGTGLLILILACSRASLFCRVEGPPVGGPEQTGRPIATHGG